MYELRFDVDMVLMDGGMLVRLSEKEEEVRPSRVQQGGLLMQTRSLTGQCWGDLCELGESSGVKVGVRLIVDVACELCGTW